MGEAYFKWWLGDNDKTTELVFEYDGFNLKDISKLEDGVYYSHFGGFESHHYVWLIMDGSIWLDSTYGGIYDITVKEYNLKDYMKKFIIALEGDLDSYGYVFDIYIY
jgi:hypothetical protein